MIKELETVEICDLLKTAKTIAVVGISASKEKVSRSIASFLLENNYRVVGVNPAAPSIPGIPVYKTLSDIPFPIDIIDVFRRAETIDEIIPEVIALNPRCLWLQLGIRNDTAALKAYEKGIAVVQDKCIYVSFNQCKSGN